MKRFGNWVCDAGMWEVSDPPVPPFPSGRTLDRFPLLPRSKVFEARVPPAPGVGLGLGGRGPKVKLYTAKVMPANPLSAPSPVLLVFPFFAGKTQPMISTLNTAEINPEEWSCPCNLREKGEKN